MNTIKIAWLFPDTLYLHGDRGNILALEKAAKHYNLDVSVDKIDFDTDDFAPMNYDIIFCPPGELTSFPVIIEYLNPFKDSFEKFIAEGRPLIATGTSMAIWCSIIKRTDGSSFPGLDILPAEASENPSVYGDDLYFTCSYNGKDFDIIGNQIQMADFISETGTCFGTLHYGYGNTGRTREEGFKLGNSIFTNSLGPLLVLNPWLTAEIIRAAAENKGIDLDKNSYDMELEKKSFATKKDFILSKETKLTNCKE